MSVRAILFLDRETKQKQLLNGSARSPHMWQMWGEINGELFPLGPRLLSRVCYPLRVTSGQGTSSLLPVAMLCWEGFREKTCVRLTHCSQNPSAVKGSLPANHPHAHSQRQDVPAPSSDCSGTFPVQATGFLCT